MRMVNVSASIGKTLGFFFIFLIYFSDASISHFNGKTY
jgi:hypothetical protein